MNSTSPHSSGAQNLSEAESRSVLESARALQGDGSLLERALEHTSCGITLSDARHPEMPLVWVNTGFLDITGYPLDEVIGRNCRFLQQNDKEQPARFTIRRALETRRHCRVVMRNYNKEGELFYNELTVSPAFDGEGHLTHFVGVQTDVTRRERALLDNIRLLEDLRRSNRQMEDFARIVFNELRSPLRGLGKVSELLVEGHSEKLDGRAAGLLQLLKERSLRLEDLLQGVLGYTLTAGTDGSSVRVPLRLILKRLVEDLSPPSGIEIVVADDLPMLRGDRYRFEEIFRILLGNSVQHMATHGRSEGRVVVGWAEDGGNVELWVEDDGPGIPEEDQDRVLNMFETVDDGRETEGPGVGLALLRGLVEQVRGSILVESVRPRGVRFTVLLPRTEVLDLTDER